VNEGDFIALMGYPGSTHRHLPFPEVMRQVDQVLRARIDLYGQWIGILAEQAERSSEVAIKVKAIHKSFANREKNARGMLAGIKRMDLLARRRERDARLRRLAAQRRGAGFARLFAEIESLSVEERAAYPRDFVLSAAMQGPSLLPLAVHIVRRAREREKPDIERADPYMDRNVPELRRGQERRLRTFDLEVEARLIASLVERSQQLERRISAFDHLGRLAADAGQNVIDSIRERAAASKLSDAETAERLFDTTLADLEAAEDPMIEMALELAPTLEEAETQQHQRQGHAARVLPRFFSLLQQSAPGPLYPDANGTLRFSYAEVKGYSPRDGLIATPFTTLAGQLAKHRGSEPFDLPEAVRKAAPLALVSYWSAPELGDVPVCFLTNADTTGGNSGSPVINGRGELVGLNFDRVWENIAGDFGYNVAHSRNIVVDVRYLLWLIDRVHDADALLDELGVSRYRSMPARSPNHSPPRPPATGAIGCQLARGSKGPEGSLAGPCPWALFALWLLRGGRRQPVGANPRNASLAQPKPSPEPHACRNSSIPRALS
jgi:hypothetical protein